MKLDDFLNEGNKNQKRKNTNYLKIARELAKKNDDGIRQLLDVWDNGFKIVIKERGKNKKRIEEIPKHDPYIKKQIIKAVKLRMSGKVFSHKKSF